MWDCHGMEGGGMVGWWEGEGEREEGDIMYGWRARKCQANLPLLWSQMEQEKRDERDKMYIQRWAKSYANILRRCQAKSCRSVAFWPN